MNQKKPAVLHDHEVIEILEKEGVLSLADPMRITRSVIKETARSMITAITVEAGSQVFHLIEKLSSSRELENAAFLLSHSLPVPKIYLLDLGRNILLTEDVCVERIHGCEFDEDTENGKCIRSCYPAMMEAAAQFHLAFWEDGQIIKTAGLPYHLLHYREHLQGIEKELAVYQKQWEGRQGESGLANFEKALALLAGRDVSSTVQRYLAVRNITLIHGDLHPGNMFISAKDCSVRMIDFEAMRMGACTDDLAMLVAYHIAPGKKDAMPLLLHYHTYLAKSVNNYSFDEFIGDYCVSILENMFFSIRLINQGIPAFNLRDASLEAFQSFIL